jgi:hypothetical protein
MKLLIKFCADYADEFDVHGFAIMPESVWKERVEKFIEREGAEDARGEWYFGSNEFIEYYDSRERFVRDKYETRLITENEADVFGLLGLSTWDKYPEYGHFFNLIED